MKYSYEIYNIENKQQFQVQSIKSFAKIIDLDMELDQHDNFFFHNLENMTAVEYASTLDKTNLIFHFQNYIIIRSLNKI